jgi:hypothetical protein
VILEQQDFDFQEGQTGDRQTPGLSANDMVRSIGGFADAYGHARGQVEGHGGFLVASFLSTKTLQIACRAQSPEKHLETPQNRR